MIRISTGSETSRSADASDAFNVRRSRMLTLGWKFLDRGYRAEGDGWKVFCPDVADDAEKCIEKAVDVTEFNSE